MGNNNSIKKITNDYYCPFSFNGATFKCKILQTLSINTFKVVFKYKNKPYTWNIKLSGCEELKEDNKVVNSNIFLSELLSENNNEAKIICGELKDGYIESFLYLKSETKTLNELLKENYELNNRDNVINFIDYENSEDISNIIENEDNEDNQDKNNLVVDFFKKETKIINVKPDEKTSIFNTDFYNELNKTVNKQSIQNI